MNEDDEPEVELSGEREGAPLDATNVPIILTVSQVRWLLVPARRPAATTAAVSKQIEAVVCTRNEQLSRHHTCHSCVC
jgi:hypothetical protein